MSFILIPILELQHTPLPPKCCELRSVPQLFLLSLFPFLNSHLNLLRMWGCVSNYYCANTKQLKCNFCEKKHVNGTSKIKKHLGNLRGHDIVGSFDVPLIMALEIWLIERWGSPWILIGYFVIYCFKDFEILKFLKIRYLYLFLVLEF